MLGKFLLTAAVILIAFALIRQRSRDAASQQRSASDSGQSKAAIQQSDKQDSGLASDLRIGAYLFLVMMIGLGAVLYYYRWQDQHTVITVTLHRDGQQAPISYEVYKYQLGERSFTTIDGLSVTVAASERMVVDGLQD